MDKKFLFPLAMLLMTTFGSFLGYFYLNQMPIIEGDKKITEEVILPLREELKEICIKDCDKLIIALEIMEHQNKAKIEFTEDTFSLWFKFNLLLLLLSLVFCSVCYNGKQT